VSATADHAEGQRHLGARLGIRSGQVVQELGYDEDLSYCLGCMSIATAALETASGIDRFSEGLDDERHHLRPIGRMTDALGALDDDDDDEELNLVDPILAFDDEEDDLSGELVLDDDVETVRTEAARLTTQLEAAARRMAALEARRAALIRRLEDSGR